MGHLMKPTNKFLKSSGQDKKLIEQLKTSATIVKYVDFNYCLYCRKR